MDDSYARLEQAAKRLALDQFVAQFKRPVLLLDLVDSGAVVAGPVGLDSTVVSDPGRNQDEDDGETSRVAFELAEQTAGAPISIGRSEECDLVIDRDSISKVHAHVITASDGALQIRDAHSRNGVTVNGRRVSSDRWTRLRADDVVRFGSVIGRIVYPAAFHALLRGKPHPRSMRRQLRDRTFAAFWLGQTLVEIGDGMLRVLLIWWVLDRTASGAAISKVTLCGAAALLLILLVGGAVLDRVPRARVLLFSALVRACVPCLLAYGEYTGSLALWHVVVAAAVVGACDAFLLPGFAALVTELVPRDDLPVANALNVVAQRGGNIIGPVLAAVFVEIGGLGLAIAIVGALALAGSLFLARVPVTRRAPRKQSVAELRFRDAVRGMLADPWLWGTSAIFAAADGIGSALTVVAMPVLIEQSLHLDLGYYAVIRTLFPVGALLGSVWMSKRAISHRRGLFAYLMAAGIGASIIVVGLPITIYGIAVVSLFRGVAINALWLTWITSMQEIVPRTVLGRTASLDSFVRFGIQIASVAAVGPLVVSARPETLFLLGGGLTLLFAVLGLVTPRIRTFD